MIILKFRIPLKRSLIVTLSRITSLHQTFLMTEGTSSCSFVSQGLQQMDLHVQFIYNLYTSMGEYTTFIVCSPINSDQLLLFFHLLNDHVQPCY